jgi:TRAP-type C4-dicarboxylate transport system substrate-binding protein
MRRSAFIATVLLVCTVLFTAEPVRSQAPAPTQELPAIKLKIADTFPIGHTVVEYATKFFINRVEQLSNGQVTFQYFPSGQIGNAKDMLQLTRSGVADIAYIGPAYVGTMPLSSVVELPGTFASSREAAPVFWKLANGYLLDKEYLRNGVRPVLVFATAPYQIWNTKREVKSVGDAKGLKLRTAGGAMDLAVKTIGAVPIASPPAEMYESIQRGTMDGSVLAASSVRSYKVDDLVKYGMIGANLGLFVGTYSINEQVWQRLPDAAKRALMTAGEEATTRLAEVLDKEVVQLNEEFRKKGIKMYQLTDADKKAWADVLTPVAEKWAKMLDDKGQPGSETLKEFRRVMASR